MLQLMIVVDDDEHEHTPMAQQRSPQLPQQQMASFSELAYASTTVHRM
jgi:hypothetical protein